MKQNKEGEMPKVEFDWLPGDELRCVCRKLFNPNNSPAIGEFVTLKKHSPVSDTMIEIIGYEGLWSKSHFIFKSRNTAKVARDIPVNYVGIEIRTDNSKPSNPKDAVGSKKARWFSYIPVRVMVGVGMALFEGARKYGRHNYRAVGVRTSVYVDAAISGHLMPFMEGQDIDPDSGLHHIDKAIASLMVLRDGIYEGNVVDDRPPAVKNWDAFMAEQHKKAEEIITRYPNPIPAYTNSDRDFDKHTGVVDANQNQDYAETGRPVFPRSVIS